MNGILLEKYAQLIVKKGVNIQKKQILVINSPIESAAFARMIAQKAYDEGAKDVVINWKDEQFSRIRYLSAPEEVFEEFPEWQKELYIFYARQGAAFVSIAASDPELMQDVNPGRLAKSQKVSSIALKEYRGRLMNGKNAWCVVSVPTKSWAKKVFPGLKDEDAAEKLWEIILKTVRADKKNPTASWEKHINNLKKSKEFLNFNRFKFLQFRTALGTDLKIELPENHIWLGGSEYTPEGIEFIANMPTEEVFTLPLKTGVNGTAVSSKPLNYNGNLIENFILNFKDGRIVDYRAEKGYETLKNLIETDEGSCYLGEVALVPYDSPVSMSGILFYNTLFDENASSHLAIGKAYPACIQNGKNLNEEELQKLGANDSLVHEDFMIGTGDLEITGITSDGKEMHVFKKGSFAFNNI